MTRPAPTTDSPVRRAARSPSPSVIGRAADRLLQAGDRLVELSLLAPARPQVRPGARVVGVEPDRLPELGLGLRGGEDGVRIVAAAKGLKPNVDFYSASVYHYLNIPSDLFTPIFAISRTSGWLAHVMEQYAHNKLIRPRAEYAGPRNQHWAPIERR